MAEPLPAEYKFSLYRGDTRVWEHHFNEDPPDWAASTAYVVGVVGSGEYVANSTVTQAGVTYTCIVAHTSGASFEAANWRADPEAVGPPEDLTGYVFEAQYRTVDASGTVTTTGDPLASDTCTLTNAAGGILRRTLPHAQALLLTSPKVAWDLQATFPDTTTVRTFLKNKGVKVEGDVSV